ncbi:MAG TPA: DinB family protein [Acidimicrobiia bacterium]
MAITPDTKDWTWVLERQCPECGFDATQIPPDDIGRMIRQNAAAWRLVLARADVTRRFRDDMWTPLEYGCHVRDVNRIMDARLALMLTEDEPTFANWDQDATAAEDAYDTQDPERVASELDTAARRVAERFDGVGGEQWSRSGMRSDGSRFTVESLGRYAVHDLQHHIHDLAQFGIDV